MHDDPHQWLEDIDGEAALDWVRAKNAATTEALTEQAAFTDLKERLLGIYDSDERIPFLRLLAEGSEEYVNFWQSAAHPRGVWRKTTLSSYRTDEPAWQTLLDWTRSRRRKARAGCGREPRACGRISCLVPLLDMKRYHLLLAGASWMGEYGDPDDPDDWAFMKGFSPYHNLSATTEDPPPMLIATSTRDDRVHPGHARKFKAAIDALGRDNVLYYENIEGGHGIAANNAQRAFMRALSYTFLWQAVTDE